MARANPYESGLAKNAANYAPLSPLSLLARTAYTYPQRAAVIHGERRLTWAEVYARCRRLASSLSRLGVGVGDTVAVMAANTPEIFEAHFGVPMTGGVLNTLNTRLDADTLAFMLTHGNAKVLLTDTEFSPVMTRALSLLDRKPRVIDIDDALGIGGNRLGEIDYEAFIAGGDPDYAWQHPGDEWNAISLNPISRSSTSPIPPAKGKSASSAWCLHWTPRSASSKPIISAKKTRAWTRWSS